MFRKFKAKLRADRTFRLCVAGGVLLLVLLPAAVAFRLAAGGTQTDGASNTASDQSSSAMAETPRDLSGDLSGDSSDSPSSAAAVVLPESISLTFEQVTLYVGQSKMPIVTMLPENAADKSEIWATSDASVATVNSIGNITGVAPGSCTVTVRAAANKSVGKSVAVTVVAAPKDAEPTYIQGVLIVNKTYGLPSSYGSGITAQTQQAFNRMKAAAQNDGIRLWIQSGFRSYSHQERIYNNYVARDGQAKADTYSARPGHSEHQTGLALDLNTINDSFAGTQEAEWLAAHAHEYGFIIRYPKDKQHITGYKYEPWHVRYLGEDLACKVYESGLCLEEYFGITSVYGN